MTLLFKIIRAAHANGTHHRLALDALCDLGHPEAEGWQRVFLRHADLYMEGAKAPDDKFKDFKNHVLHVGDTYWGGAAERVQSWYAILVRELKAGNWPEAIYAAGVLSHYFVDPIHPFHTAQSEAENNIHRAVEWSISKSYEELRQMGLGMAIGRPEPTNEADWLADFVCAGAERSHASYGHLIAHYDFNKGVVDPPAGLDATARRIVADLLVYASGGLAAVLDRAIKEADVAPPAINLTVDTVLATLKVPLKFVLKKMTDGEDRRQVEAMYDELMATGKVEENLPEDDRAVRALHAKEVVGKREEERLAGRADRLATPVPVKQPVPLVGTPAVSRPPQPPALKAPASQVAPLPANSVPITRSVTQSPPPPEQAAVLTPEPQASGALAATAAAAHAITTARAEEAKPRTLEEAVSRMRAALDEGGGETNTSDMAAGGTVAGGTVAGDRAREDEAREDEVDAARLALADEVVDAPSIGPKTAARLNAAGVQTVRDLLDADPGALSELLDTRHITARTIRDWQYQSRLMLDMPGLNGTEAQLLVGAGYTTAQKVREASGTDLVKAVGEFVKSAEGQRLLRFGKAPERERIAHWPSLAGKAAEAA